jgi:hypothetical protein
MTSSSDLEDTIRALVALFLPLCSDTTTLLELQKLLENPELRGQGHNLFSCMRHKNLKAIDSRDILLQSQYCFEEICAKCLYNLTDTDAPFDDDSPDWVVPCAQDFAKVLGLAEDTVSSKLGPNNSFKPTPHRGVGHVPALR